MRTFFSEQEKQRFFEETARQFQALYPEPRLFTERGLDLDLFFERYFAEYGTGKGIFQTKQENKRMVDAIQARFTQQHELQLHAYITQGLQPAAAIDVVRQQAQGRMLPYLIAHYTRYWRKKYGTGRKQPAAPASQTDKISALEELLKKL